MQRFTWLIVLIAGLAFAFSIEGWKVTAVSALLAVCVILLAWWMSPFSGGRTKRHADVMALPAEQRRVVAYWRPGCIFCQRLRGGLGSDAKKVTWINIWQDPDAAAFVRSVNNGDETVPTVVVDGEVLVNPDPRTVREAL
ncbi:hypothetical protein H5392_09390 [Tessaracoccus sp. MC1865]|uniref:glutaredoxin domain-containing protein n=1 Tax=unclassified Tessaracoccus TaxID=2635419 RepID=UPI0016033B84|nr:MULTISPECIES: glutaredoxin domain-containing protein [unclassified Tessaracoccus]MBB1484072.1 hypothetical protein [Tessaracoccus sp. MC1865]MBB1508421.1 hypothetical protein [Tessaracoccus sp. MC1756]QTO37106.1 hypothetical protein J7D54_11760 [Tessaracoccus sp. MC1865]